MMSGSCRIRLSIVPDIRHHLHHGSVSGSLEICAGKEIINSFSESFASQKSLLRTCGHQKNRFLFVRGRLIRWSKLRLGLGG